MKKGTQVSWLATDATVRAFGITISDEDENGYIQVSVDGGTFEYIPLFYRIVIHCPVRYLDTRY